MWDDELLEAAAGRAAEVVDAADDVRASAAYREHLVPDPRPAGARRAAAHGRRPVSEFVEIEVTVNGVAHAERVPGRLHAADFLRARASA